jgi:hypothetical protein
MTKKIFLVLIITFYFVSCSKKGEEIIVSNCAATNLNESLKYNDLVFNIQENLIIATTEQPNALGALDRNKNGYFHVRFQFNMSKLTDYAVKFQSKEAIQEYVNNLNYSFSYQNQVGDFQFIPPDDLLNSPDYQSPTEGDLASGTAFFAYSLGIGLNTLTQSEWYRNSTSIGILKQNIIDLDPNIQNLLNYLKNSKQLLKTVDANAPNRLLFDAIAFYSLGIYLNNQEAKNIGIEFVQEALLQRNIEAGYFIESGGWDSSYNGVAIKLCFELFTLLDRTIDQPIKDELGVAVSCATDWQKSRILTTGEISTEGNTRVFSGGETFLGNEKQVDALKTAWAFFYMSTLTNDNDLEQLGLKILDYYD